MNDLSGVAAQWAATPDVFTYDGAVSGQFIALEGIDGCGKSTQLERLVAIYGDSALVVREPGGTRLGEQIRRLLLDPETGHIDPAAEALLYAASRAELVRTVIAPALIEGRTVIADRFVGSSLAYQGVGRNLGIDAVRRANELAMGATQPSLTFLLDIDVPTSYARRSAAGEEPDRLEAAGTDFFERVRTAYHELAAADPDWVVIDASESADAVAEQIEQHLAQRAMLPGVRS